jgi:hypothetical protein
MSGPHGAQHELHDQEIKMNSNSYTNPRYRHALSLVACINKDADIEKKILRRITDFAVSTRFSKVVLIREAQRLDQLIA